MLKGFRCYKNSVGGQGSRMVGIESSELGDIWNYGR